MSNIKDRAKLVDDILNSARQLNWSVAIPADDNNGGAILIAGHHQEVVKTVQSLMTEEEDTWIIYYPEDRDANNIDKELN